jgi:surface antigen
MSNEIPDILDALSSLTLASSREPVEVGPPPITLRYGRPGSAWSQGRQRRPTTSGEQSLSRIRHLHESGLLQNPIGVQLTTDRDQAVKAYLVATAGQGVFEEIEWHGAFRDEHGVFYVYLAPYSYDETLKGYGDQEIERMHPGLLAAFTNLTSPLLLLESQLFDTKALSALHSNLRQFQSEFGLIQMPSFSLSQLRQISLGSTYVLDYETCLKELTEKQRENLLTSKAFNITDLSSTEETRTLETLPLAEESECFLQLWDYVVKIPLTPRNREVVKFLIAKGIGVELPDEESQYRARVSAYSFDDRYTTAREVVTTSDPQVAAKALLIAKFGGEAFSPIKWIGEFSDEDGRYYAFSRSGFSHEAVDEEEYESFFSDAANVCDRYSEMKQDMGAATQKLRKFRMLSDLRVEVNAFEGVTGFKTRMIDDGRRKLFLNIGAQLVLDGEKSLPDLSSQQTRNILFAARTGMRFLVGRAAA